jgi:hypothetical protein
MYRAAKEISKCLPHTSKESRGSLSKRYSGLKRRRYEQAELEIATRGFHRNMASITMFVKDEKMNPNSKVNPDPRPIQFRDSRYCVAIAQFLKPIEEHLYNLRGRRGSKLPPTRLIGKGLNQCERAQVLLEKFNRFKKPVCVSIDATRFDKHCHEKALKVEHSVYQHCNNDPFFQELLTMQLDNHCFTRSGFHYRVRGKRMSGDMNTALGNCILMVDMVTGLFLDKGIEWDLFDDGDDCLVFFEAHHLDWFLSLAPKAFLSFGHEIKIENIAYDMPSVLWCQSRPLQYAPGKWKFTRDPVKTMSCDLSGTKWKISPQARLRLLASIGQCELVLNLGVPILQEYAVAVMRAAGKARPFKTLSGLDSALSIRMSRELRSVGFRHSPVPITETARLSFEMAWGISPGDQLVIEEALSKWVICSEGNNDIGQLWDVSSWRDLCTGHYERYL